MANGNRVAELYSSQKIQGWLGTKNPELVKSQFKLLSDAGFIQKEFKIQNKTRDNSNRKMMLYDVVRKVLGQDTLNFEQLAGSCVAFGMKNVLEYSQCTQILMEGDHIKWRPIFHPYLYGIGRTYVGEGQMRDGEDGSMGSWMATAVQKYGTLFRDEPGLPKIPENYTAQIDRSWGNRNSKDDLDKWLPMAKNNLVKTVAQINSWSELVDSICNGFAVTTASDIGYNMNPSSDGFHHRAGSWSHQMAVIGVSDNDKDPYAIILNSWGDCHSHLKDFDDGSNLPVGVLRVRRRDIEAHIAAEETYAISHLVGFPEQDLDKELFQLI